MTMKQIFGRVRVRRLLFSLLCALCVLLPASKSSPLYPTNDWVDVQCFFTVGREMLRGKMPYLDLYEQKGPLLYLLFALAGVISSADFTGVFCLEVLCFTLFLNAALASLPSQAHPLMALTAPLMAALTVLSPAFRHGTSAEELSLFLYTGSAALILRPARENRAFSRKECAALGAAFAAVILIKYTGALFFLPLFLYGLLHQIRLAGVKEGLRAVGYVLAGLLMVTFAVLLPYALCGALGALVDVYFVKNLTGYASATARYGTPLDQMGLNWMITLPGALGCLMLFLSKRTRFAGLSLAGGYALLFFGTYYSGRTYPYYALVFASLVPLFFAGLPRGLSAPGEKARKGAAVLTALAVLLSGALSWCLTENAYLRFQPREAMPAYRFAALIKERGGSTLLNDGFLDGGFYLASGISPTCPYFCELALRPEEWAAEKEKMVQEGAFDFIVTRGRTRLPDFYVPVATASWPFEGREWTYTLYQNTLGQEKTE